MASISATTVGPPYFSPSYSYSSQVEGPPSLPQRSIAELTSWISSEIHSPLGTTEVCVPILVPIRDGNLNGSSPEPAHANDGQGQPEGIATSATTAIIPSGLAVPTMYTASVYQGTELGSFPPLSEPSRPLMAHHMAVGGITIHPHFLEYTPSSGDFPTVPRNPTQSEVLYDCQPSRHVNTTQDPITNCTPAVTASVVSVYPPPFNQTLGGYLVSGRPFSSSLVNPCVTSPSRTTYQTKKSRQNISRLLGQTDRETSTLSASPEPTRGVRTDQQPRRHQCTTCNAEYASVSGLNRHITEKHSPLMACICGFQYPSGRKYLLTRHLETGHPTTTLTCATADAI